MMIPYVKDLEAYFSSQEVLQGHDTRPNPRTEAIERTIEEDKNG